MSWRRLVPPWLATALFLAAITALARISGLKLLLFPELAALASVLFRDPTSPWARSPRLLVLTPTLTAVVGLLVSTWLPYGPLATALVVSAGLLVLAGLRSAVAPALSAGYLPLALGIRSWTYPLAILLGLLALLSAARLLPPPASDGDRPPCGDPASDPLPPPRRWLLPLLLFLAGALGLARLLGTHLVLYPPLLVIAWETLAHRERCPWSRRPFALLAATTVAALLGLLLARGLGPVPLAAFLAALLTALLLKGLRLSCPPAYAVAVVPLVLTQPPLAYPLVVLVGGAWLVLVAAVAAQAEIRALAPGRGGHPRG